MIRLLNPDPDEFAGLFDVPTEGKPDDVATQPAGETVSSGTTDPAPQEEEPGRILEDITPPPKDDQSPTEVAAPPVGDELTELRAQLEALRLENSKLMAEARAELLVDVPVAPTPAPSSPSPEQPQPSVLPPTGPGVALPSTMSFTDDDMNMLASPEHMQKVADKIRAQTAYHIMQALPSMIHNISYQMLEMQRVEHDFFSQNTDLIPFKAAVEKVATIYRAQDPKMTLGQVLEKGAETVRKKLNLEKKRAASAPALPGRVTSSTPARRPAGPTQKTIAAKILELADILPKF